MFSEDGLVQILNAARSHEVRLALDLVHFATEIQANSILVLRVGSAVAESAGDSSTASELADRCVAMEIQNGDWRAHAAYEECRELARRLHE